jgi:hypothetical protein
LFPSILARARFSLAKLSQMTSGSAHGPWRAPAGVPISADCSTALGKDGVLALLLGLLLAMTIAGADAHDTIDIDKANELVAAADSAADRALKASHQGNEGEMLFSLGTVLVEATDLLNRDMAAHSGQLTVNGQLLLKGFAQRNLAPHFDQALNRYLLPREQLREAIRLAPASPYAPRARFALLRASFYESFAFDPFKPLQADIRPLQQESAEAGALVPLLDDPDEKEEAAFIHAIDLAREVKLTAIAEIPSTVEKARAALRTFAQTYPDSMRAASASVVLQGLERTQQ